MGAIHEKYQYVSILDGVCYKLGGYSLFLDVELWTSGDCMSGYVVQAKTLLHSYIGK